MGIDELLKRKISSKMELFQLFKQSFLQSRLPEAIMNLAGIIEEVNPAMCKLLGYPESDLLGNHYKKITQPDQANAMQSRFQELASGKSTYFSTPMSFIHQSGEVIQGTWEAMATAGTESTFILARITQ